MSARAYPCTSCGGLVDEQARRCRYCSAPVATVRCATCFHMNVPQASYCSGCGRQLGLEPVGRLGSLPCPVCKLALSEYEDEGGKLYDCGQCGGQFVDHGLLRGLLDRHEHVALPEGVMRANPADCSRASYIPCPECGSLMNRKNFGTASGVIVDVCKKHGTWFEAAGLPHVIAFVASGGLEKVRRREVEEAHRMKREAAVALAYAAATQAHGVTHNSSEREGRVADIADLFSFLLG